MNYDWKNFFCSKKILNYILQIRFDVYILFDLGNEVLKEVVNLMCVLCLNYY